VEIGERQNKEASGGQPGARGCRHLDSPVGRIRPKAPSAANLDLETITAQLALRIDEELHGKGGKDDGKGKPSIAGLTANLMARHGHDSLANTEDLN
jgi:hypothetical protein